mmetsp:Transcript_24946/g.34375  ORF Transcript_24946/g.34375 Transcript_24946/m.34375 type:complete len:150 (+) Transcript_24946:95-544(+)|eukprot:CAMPEP_0196586254 /NCGR_PEP_ID=MMETSP1081-20130531/53665_1 /TAXON_ID=36882 /ORGANISM="Pyramimonas amylifera, Strain CCMP720" /LENGTH=149 /DNA_ID=CAMNT_0041908069 /DNA_START=90 /DNA_END=539 /DNA_ORIENTATION=+
MYRPNGSSSVVVPSGYALSVVERWMSSTSTSSSVADDASQRESNSEATRPSRLGLGAKYLSHKKAVSASPAEQRLGKKLQQYKTQGGGGSEAGSKYGSRVETDENDEEEDDEEESKASAFSQKRKHFSTFSRTNLLQTQPRGKKKMAKV